MAKSVADKELQDNLTVGEYVEGSLLPHPLGFSLQIKKSKVDHPESGYGVFVHGHIIPGTVIAFYPGIAYYPPQLTPEIVTENEYMISRYDNLVIDGRKWDQRGTSLGRDTKRLEYAGIDVSLNEMKKFQNRFAIGNYINHPPPGSNPNVVNIAYDFGRDDDVTALPEELIPYIPNIRFQKSWLYWNDHLMPTVLIMAAQHIEDEELFLNYRFNPNNPYPSWYAQPDEEEAKRRWAKIKLFGRWR